MKKIVQALWYAILIKFSSLFKMSFIIGSYISWFSASSIVAPVAGAFVGITGSSIVVITRMVLHFLFFKTISIKFLALCIPGFFASLYWATNSRIIHLLTPIACIILFIAHPVGTQAFIYSSFWLIPIALCFFPQKTLFLKALGSTLTAHAVGSVIWLYTTPMTPQVWLGLIPLVVCERLLCATGMAVLYSLIKKAQSLKTFLPVYNKTTLLTTK